MFLQLPLRRVEVGPFEEHGFALPAQESQNNATPRLELTYLGPTRSVEPTSPVVESEIATGTGPIIPRRQAVRVEFG